MTRTPARILADPIVMGAIAARGLDARGLPWKDDEMVVDGTRDLPSLNIGGNGNASISWYRAKGMVRYALDDEGGVLTIERQETPETILAALAGRDLKALVDVPGADRMRIVVAVNSRAFISDPLDTRVQVECIDASGSR